MAMPTISIIIPVYNVETFLRTCLDSIVNQTYIEKEIILVNDGSSDDSGAICDEYSSRYPFVKVIHKTNNGPSAARNLGIEVATGKRIIFVDADDLWADNRCLEKLYAYAVSFNLDIVRFEYLAVNEQLEPLSSSIYDKKGISDCILDNYSMVKYAIASEWFTVLFLIRRDILSDIRFKEDKNFLEDCDFYCRIFASAPLRCGYLNERLYIYRKRKSSITATYKIKNLKDAFELCDVFYEASIKILDENLKRLYIYYSVMMYYWTLQTLAAQPYFFKRISIIKELRLDALHARILDRIDEAGVKNKYRIFIMPVPDIGVRLLHIKDKFRSWFA